ncbi:hypothetical protein D3C71_1509070 [compost metagenome]
MVGKACEHIAQIRLRIEPVQLGRFHQTVNRRGPLASSVRTHEEIVGSAKGHAAQGALSRVVVDLDAAIVTVAGQRCPARERIANRLGQFRLPGDLAQHAREPSTQVIQQRPGAGLSHLASHVGRLTPDLGFDRVQRRNALQRLLGNRARHEALALMQIPEGAARVSPASRFDDAPTCVDLAVPAIGIGLEDAAVVRKMCLRMFPLAVGRVAIPSRGRLHVSCGPVVAHVHPQSAGLVRPRPGSSTATGVSSACTFSPASV